MKPRLSGIPTPGRSSGIPTPGRPRSTSSAQQYNDIPASDSDFANRAFQDAIKANDPAQHRSTRTSDASTAALSPLTSSHSNGSVYSRPSSVASSSASFNQSRVQRAKTPTSARPPSRSSDVFARSSSRAGRGFEVGDSVRIESLGFEGVLRYVGSIDGKDGLFAGVELSGGFAGMGKNNGSVSGKAYFTCPEKCGVFTLTTKLSPATTGYQRPSSVASSRGRTTPALSSGRITPSNAYRNTRASISNGRVTPGGRTTPSFHGPETPTARVARIRATSKAAAATPTASARQPAVQSSVITSGSRASKYASMTAKELRSGKDATPIRTPGMRQPSVPSSPGPMPRTLSSPSRSTGSPFTTPKPRPSSAAPGTPRARIPSAVAMPPPPSPNKAGDETFMSSAELTQRGKALQDQIASLTSSSWAVPSSPSPRRPASSASGSDQRELLQLRIDALERDNALLRSTQADVSASSPTPDPELYAKLEALQSSYESATAQLSVLKAEVADAKATVTSRDSRILELDAAHTAALNDIQNSMKNRVDSLEGDIHDLKGKLEESKEEVKNLNGALSEKTVAQEENDKLLEAKTAEWAASETRLKRMAVDLEEEKRDLAAMVEELRQAGQETIALYEERLHTSENQRYEFEDKAVDLERKLAAVQTTGVSPTLPSAAPTTAEIDNESLREQVVHLQRKVSTLEDLVEDTRATADREEAAVRDRLTRAKDREDALKKEIHEGRKEVERVLKSEANARGRVEEIEEALRESTVALENAQAEVEGLRLELDNLNGLVASNSTNDNSSTIKDLEAENLTLRHKAEDLEEQLIISYQTVNEQTEELEAIKKKINRDQPVTNGLTPHSPSSSKREQSAREEVKGLKHIVQELQKENVTVAQQTKVLESENQLLRTEADSLRQEIAILEDSLDQSIAREENTLDEGPAGESDDTESLKRMLKEQRLKFETEIEQLRKQLTDLKFKNDRATHELNKEISELEALVESKIYREDELEQEIERLKDKLSRQKKSSKSSIETIDSYQRHSIASSVTSSSDSEQVCEICERPGHDIFTCDLLKEDVNLSTGYSKVSTDLYCEDCEGHGHVAADCPHSQDVF